MSEKIHLRLDPKSCLSHADALRYIFGSVEELGEREAWPESLVSKVNLVLEELGLNILSHGGEDREVPPEIEIVLTSEDDTLTINISDNGHPFNPLQDAAAPDLNAILEDRPIGGLGVHLVRTLMDDLSYQRTAGKNCLTMVARKD